VRPTADYGRAFKIITFGDPKKSTTPEPADRSAAVDDDDVRFVAC